jgi:hypothetical protein
MLPLGQFFVATAQPGGDSHGLTKGHRKLCEAPHKQRLHLCLHQCLHQCGDQLAEDGNAFADALGRHRDE